MCLGIPGKIVEIIDEEHGLVKADVGGVRRAIATALLDDDPAQVGDWVLIHVGFAIAKINEEEAQANLRALEEIGEAYQQEMADFRASRII